MENLRQEQEPIQPEQKESVVINLFKDMRPAEQLKEKLMEYEERQARSQIEKSNIQDNPELMDQTEASLRDSHYKIVVLEKLLKELSLDSNVLLNEMKQQEGENFSQADFDNAVGVIEQYAKPEGPEAGTLEGGTGLNQDIAVAGTDFKENINTGIEVPKKNNQDKTGETPAELKGADQIKEQKKIHGIEILSDFKIMQKSPKEIAGAFREATGEHLREQREKMVDKSLGEEHIKVIRGKDAVKEYREQAIAKEQKRALEEERAKALDILWARNSNVEEGAKGKYLNNIKEKLGLLGTDGDIAISKLINDGYVIEKAKVGWLSGKINLAKVASNEISVYKNKKDLLERVSQKGKEDSLKGAQTKVDLNIVKGRKRLLAEREVWTKNLIYNEVEKYKLEKEQLEKKQREEAEKKEQPKLPEVGIKASLEGEIVVDKKKKPKATGGGRKKKAIVKNSKKAKSKELAMA